MSEITASISRMPTLDKYFSKTLGKNYSFPAFNVFSLAKPQQERNLNDREMSRSIFPDNVKQVYDTEIKLILR